MTKGSFIWRAGAIALLGLGFVLPASGKDVLCSFQAKGLSMSFGNLDPSSNANVTVAVQAATLNADKVGDCQPGNQTLQITADNGLNFSGTRRLKNTASADFIAYNLTGLPLTMARPGNNTFATFTFSGTIAGAAYANAPAGTYSDTVLISVNP